jgi:hypothetical protein
VSVHSSLSSSFLSPTSDAAAPSDPRRGRTRGMGRSPRPAGPHTEGPVCAHAHESNPAPGRDSPFCPRVVRPCIVAGAEEAGATSAALSVKVGADWGIRLDVRGTGLQRQGKAETRAPKPPTPIGVFPFFTSERAVRGREKARRRCVEPRRNTAHRSAADAPRPEFATAVTRRGEEAVCAGGGAGLGAGTSTPP